MQRIRLRQSLPGIALILLYGLIQQVPTAQLIADNNLPRDATWTAQAKPDAQPDILLVAEPMPDGSLAKMPWSW